MANNPYSTQSISGYNSSPPPDDGSQSSANQVEWAKHIDKIGDPLKTLAEAINSAVLSAFGQLLLTDDPAEETVLIATQEFGNMPLTGITRKAIDATNAQQAADLSAFSENVVVGMEEFS